MFSGSVSGHSPLVYFDKHEHTILVYMKDKINSLDKLASVEWDRVPLPRSYAVSSPWVVRPKAHILDDNKHGTQADLRIYIEDGRILSHYNVVPLKKIPARVLKYDVSLRDASLRAVQAMHTILTRMVLFNCTVCMERFPTFHPAYEPPPSIAANMEILKRGSNGLAACSIEVHSWEEVPPFV